MILFISESCPFYFQLPFSVIGSLNGVHMFGSNQDVLLTSTCTDNTRVCWRVFRDSITLIVMSSEEDASDLYLSRLLDNVFGAMVLVIGLDDLVNLKNVERLKRELRACYKLIDSLLTASDWIGDLTLCVDCVVSPDAAILQVALEVFVAAAQSHFGCLMVMGKVVVATEKWWRLAAQEVVLLTWLVGSLAPNSSRDYPIYLPQGSPTVPHRLLTFQLVPGVDVCLLCGPTPSLQQVQTELVERFWSPVLEPLKTCLSLHQCTFPICIPLHHSIIGLLLINREQNKNLFTLQPHGVERSQLPVLLEEFHAGFTHSPTECYVAADDHKSYGIQTRQHQLLLTFTPETPTFTLRNIATKTLSLLTKEVPF
ncbi:protein fuzzy homolog isoform X3 [Leucoraja erinacea]|uniref:protein fuzzy homolog isoform X3 n=1 Tax=Leucoraja erinaceus TaxID=7782 RepID=UPI002456B5AE|nr:protein fuzzy homolog isoform X3 [Leucoraja erinacea]